jgi:superfamily II DNA/RNA helicase
LKKLGIEQLNAMQLETQKSIETNSETILLSPTGTGKTLAFLLPLVAQLDENLNEVQVLILAPSRELAIQIEQVAREMGSGFKTNVVYGGRAISKDKVELQHPPAMLIGTPGRVADHLRRNTFSIDSIKTLVLDEFDKSLEIGFEAEMAEIARLLPNVRKKILTSATQGVSIPAFVGLKNPTIINYLAEGVRDLKLEAIISPSKDKLETLAEALIQLKGEPGIVFCNFKESIHRVSEFLFSKGINHGCFYGGMEQQDRERALIKFRNGTHQLLLATDLAARGIDVPEIKFIIHYHLPIRSQEFIHRNGRTARMHRDGTAYVLHWEQEALPDFIPKLETANLSSKSSTTSQSWKTLFITGGRRDKISKGDIVGWLLKQGQLENNQVGMIELKTDCAFVSVHSEVALELIQKVNNTKLKTKKVRVTGV